MRLTRLSLACLMASVMAACSPPPTYEEAPEAPAPSPMETAVTEPAPAPHSDDEDHYAGEAHVHGAADLAIVQEANFITVTIDAPLANFGLPESTQKKAEDLEDKYAEGMIELMGDARCDMVERSAQIRRTGGHAALTLSNVWDCRRPSRLDGLMFTGFELYSGFETIHAVYIGGDKQTADTLTPDHPFLPF